MLSSINLNDYPVLKADEIYGIRAKGLLSPKLNILNLIVVDTIPYGLFSTGRRAA